MRRLHAVASEAATAGGEAATAGSSAAVAGVAADVWAGTGRRAGRDAPGIVPVAGRYYGPPGCEIRAADVLDLGAIGGGPVHGVAGEVVRGALELVDQFAGGQGRVVGAEDVDGSVGFGDAVAPSGLGRQLGEAVIAFFRSRWAFQSRACSSCARASASSTRGSICSRTGR